MIVCVVGFYYWLSACIPVPVPAYYIAVATIQVVALRSERVRHMQLHFIREGDGYAEAYLARYLIEDRANFQGGNMSYTEYHSHVTRALGGAM